MRNISGVNIMLNLLLGLSHLKDFMEFFRLR